MAQPITENDEVLNIYGNHGNAFVQILNIIFCLHVYKPLQYDYWTIGLRSFFLFLNKSLYCDTT